MTLARCPWCDARFFVPAATAHPTLDELADAWEAHTATEHPPCRAPEPDDRFVCDCRYDGCPSATLEDCPITVTPPRPSPPALCHCTRPLPCPNHRKAA